MADLGLSGVKGATFVVLTLSAGLFEGFSMTMLLPVLEYTEKRQDIATLAETSKLWHYIADAFDFVGIEVSLISLLVVVFLLIMLRVVFIYFRQIYSYWLSQDILHTTRTNLFLGYLGSEFSEFDETSTGQMVNVITVEVQRVCSYFISLFSFISNVVVVSGFLVVLFMLSASMTLLAVGLILMAAFVVSFYVRHTRRLSLQTTGSNMDFAFTLVERLSAIRLIKRCAVGDREASLVARFSRNVRDNLFRLNALNCRVDLILEPAVVAAGMIILYFAVQVFQMGLAEIGVFMLILLRMLPLSKELMKSRQTLLANSGSFLAVRKAFEQARRFAEEVNEQGRQFRELAEGIQLRGVSYAYPGKEAPALADVDVFIPAKKMTALVGPSGAGKSTLVDLLTVSRRPERGRITLDGFEATDFNLHSLRKGIAFVSQETEILNDTVMANIMFASPGSTEIHVWEALRKARADAFVRSLPQGIQTVLGERGTKLSGGQRQRLSLARAFLQKASILILDEPTSALDSEVEKDIQDAIAEMRRNEETTIIIIAHRMSTIRQADKIVVLKDGRVVQEGTHDQLMATKEWYSMVNELQSR